MTSVFKRLLIGRPIATSEEQHHRLPKKVALPVFASDAISSTAYAGQEILLILVSTAGLAAYSRLVPISLMVVVLLTVVVSSYRQTIYAYPGGGGAYVVSRENLGAIPSLIAGGSMLVDYILTVAVSIASGVAAIISAFNGLASYRVMMCVGFVALIGLANLRGLKESGALFAPPTYAYIVCIVVLVGVGLFRVFVQDLPEIHHNAEQSEMLAATGTIGLFVFLKAFASGAVALSGVEAVADGVPVFKRPEPKNAAMTLLMMGVILGSTFFGLAVLAQHLKPFPNEEGDTVLAQMAEQVFGGRNLAFFITQFATFAILVLAANTAYADYPRLSSIIARDGYLPRQFTNRGDRLVFSNGILFLSLAAIALLVAFGGVVSALIPLYATGVFTGFTISQTGMCVHHWRYREPGWRARIAVNAAGALTTALVAVVVVVTKFTDGAWIPALLIPLLVGFFLLIHRHYQRVREHTAVEPGYRIRRHTHLVVVLVGSVNKGVLHAVSYARSLAPDRLIAVSVVSSPEEEHAVREQWSEHDVPVELHTIASPYRELTRPVLDYIDELDQQDPDEIITVVLPEVVTSLSTQWLHNQSALALKARLLYRPNTVVTSVPVVVD